MRLRARRLVPLIIVLVFMGIAVPAAVNNYRRTIPHEKGPNETLVIGPNSDVELRTEGCFLREQNWPTLRLKANSFSPRVLITSRGAQHTLRLIMDNISPDALTMEGAAVIERLPAQKRMVVEALAAPSKPTIVEWKPSRIEQKFSFFVFGDSHDTYKVLGAIARDMEKERPLFALNTGDLTQHGSAEEMLRHEKFADGVPVPYFTACGNHDIEKGKRTANPFHTIFGPTYYSFSYGPAFFIVVDNADGYISPTSLRWLKAQLKNSSGARETFLFAHQPPFDPRKGHYHAMKPIRGLTPLLMYIVEHGGVDYFFSGHIHSYYELERNGVHYIINGGTSVGVEPMPFPHYVIITVNNGKVEHTLRLIGKEKLQAK